MKSPISKKKLGIKPFILCFVVITTWSNDTMWGSGELIIVTTLFLGNEKKDIHNILDWWWLWNKIIMPNINIFCWLWPAGTMLKSNTLRYSVLQILKIASHAMLNTGANKWSIFPLNPSTHQKHALLPFLVHTRSIPHSAGIEHSSGWTNELNDLNDLTNITKWCNYPILRYFPVYKLTFQV